MRRISILLITVFFLSTGMVHTLKAQPFWVTSIGGGGWSGTLANNSTDNSTIYICYNTGVTFYSNATTTSFVISTKTYSRRWQSSTNGSTWTTIGTATVSSYATPLLTSNKYYRVCYSYNNSSTDIYYPSPWVQVIVGPSFVSTPSSLTCSTTNITPTSFTANWTTSSTSHGPGNPGENLVIRHYMFCSSDPTFASSPAPGFNSSCAKLMTSCTEATSAIPGCTNPNTPVSYTVSGLTPGVTYYWKIIAQSWHENSSNGDLYCGEQSLYTSVQTVEGCSAPVVTTQPATQSICSGGPGTISVVATGATSYQWLLDGTEISGATSSSYSPTLAGNYTCMTYSACDSTLTNTAVITLDQPTTANAGPDQNICANSATLAANTPLTGTGTWTVTTGTGTFTNANDPNTTVTGLSAGTNTFTWTLLNGACSDSQDQVSVNVQSTPVVVSQPLTQSVCSGNTGTLSVTATGATAYQWQLNGTDIPGATGTSYNASLAGNYTCIVYSACDSATTNAAVVTLDQSTIASAGPDQNLCASTATLAANTPLSGNGTWTVISGSGTFTNANDPNTTVTGLSTGNNTFVWTLLNGACSDSRDTVIVNMQTASTDPSGISGVANVCSGASTTLTVTGGSLGTGANWEWYSGTCGTGTHVGSGTSISVSPAADATYYAISQGGCNTTTCVSHPITVTPSSADAGPDLTLCTGDSTILTITGPGTYQWSYGGYTTPSITVKPLTNTTYYVTATNGSCVAQDTVNITVTSSADATITTTGTICTGTAPFILSSVDPGGSWSGQGITNASTGLFSAATAGPGPHQIIHTIPGSCGDADTTTITVATSSNATITPAGPFCSNVAPVNLTAATPGGTWSGLGITNPVTGTFSPSSVGAGSYNIIYTIAGTCGDDDTISITVNTAPNSTITSSGPYCTNVSAVTLSAATAGGTWSGQGITNGTAGTFSPSLTGAGTFNVMYTLSGMCGSTDTASITVNSAANASITPAGPFCSSVPSVTLTAATGGGTWSGLGITNASAGTFSPSAVGPGAYSVIYTISGVCGSSDTLAINVNAAANATITPAGPFCSSVTNVSLTAAGSGGMWSGQGITNALTGQFSPAAAGPGTWNVVYTITGTCGDDDTVSIVVNSAADATITPVGPFCYTDSPVTLTAADAGGVWSGTGITNSATGAFDPAFAGPGTHVITYVITGTCGDTANAVIVVDSVRDASILSSTLYCDNIAPFTLSAATSGGTWTGTGIINNATGLFSPALAGPGTHVIIYTIAGSCGNTGNATITIQDAPSGNVTGTTETCTASMDGTATATSSGGTAPYSYLWNNNETSATITGLEPGTWSVIITDANGCSVADSVLLEASTVSCDDVSGVVYIPNIFSPNGDGDPRNNTLVVYGQGIKNIELRIYDRWGEKIFESRDINVGWDGTYKGKDMDQGVYVYTAVVELLNGEIINKKGNITLVR